VPEVEGTDEKEVYAFFGLCSYYGQILEQGVINLAVVLRARGLTRVTGQDVVRLFDDFEQRTVGQLVRDVRQQVDFSQDLENALRVAVRDRNYLAHGFFSRHVVDFCSNPGRLAMIRELRELTVRFQTTDRMLDSVTLPLWERLGMTQEILETGSCLDGAGSR